MLQGGSENERFSQQILHLQKFHKTMLVWEEHKADYIVSSLTDCSSGLKLLTDHSLILTSLLRLGFEGWVGRYTLDSSFWS